MIRREININMFIRTTTKKTSRKKWKRWTFDCWKVNFLFFIEMTSSRLFLVLFLSALNHVDHVWWHLFHELFRNKPRSQFYSITFLPFSRLIKDLTCSDWTKLIRELTWSVHPKILSVGYWWVLKLSTVFFSGLRKAGTIECSNIVKVLTFLTVL